MSTNKERLQASITNLQNQTNIINQVETIINTLPDRHNDVMLFKSVEEMNAYPGAVDGTIAVVYKSDIQPLTEDMEFYIAQFPETVVLPEVFYGYIDVRLMSVDQSISFDCSGQLSFTRFDIRCYTDMGVISVVYTSQDGKTYTRTNFTRYDEEISGTEMNFGIVIKYNDDRGKFNPILGNFIQITNAELSGIYRYNGNIFELYTAQLDTTSEDAFDCVFYGRDGITQSTLQQVTNLNTAQIQLRRNIRNLYSNMQAISIANWYANNSIPITVNMQEEFSDVDITNVTNISGLFYNCRSLTSVSNFNTSNVKDMSGLFDYCYNLTTVPNFDTSNVVNMVAMLSSCRNVLNIPNYNTSNVMNMTYMLEYHYNLSTTPNFNTANVVSMAYMFAEDIKLTSVVTYNTANVTNMCGMFIKCNNLSDASVQNIINMCLNSNVTNTTIMNLNTANVYSIFRDSNITSERYSNRLEELTQAGWSY